jgi:hypothetical protein
MRKLDEYYSASKTNNIVSKSTLVATSLATAAARTDRYWECFGGRAFGIVASIPMYLASNKANVLNPYYNGTQKALLVLNNTLFTGVGIKAGLWLGGAAMADGTPFLGIVAAGIVLGSGVAWAQGVVDKQITKKN